LSFGTDPAKWPFIRLDATEEAAVKSALFVLLCLALGGCAVVAAPCRATADIVQTAPLVGNIAAAPPATCGDVIDPR
jgi:hypothetical protein